MSKTILEHAKKIEIDELIIKAVFDGLGSRKISELIQTEFGENVSHTAIAQYLKNYLSGNTLGNIKKEYEQKILLAAAGDGSLYTAPLVDLEKLEALNARYKSKEQQQSIAYQIELYQLLVSENTKAFLAGREAINRELVLQLKDLESISSKRPKPRKE